MGLTFARGTPATSEGRTQALFRLGVTGVCLIGFILARIMQKRTKDEPLVVKPSVIDSSKPALPPDARAITVTYRNTFDAARRCELYTLTHRSSGLRSVGQITLVGAYFASILVARFSLLLSYLTLPILHLIVFAAFLRYLMKAQPVLLRAKFPTPESVRICTSSITAEGFQDVTPERVIPIPWRNIRQIRESGGDLFIWTQSSGCYIPRHAFANLDEARRYQRTAVALWRSGGTDWPDDAPSSIDESRRAVVEVADNPYAPPQAPIYKDRESTGGWTYPRVLAWTAGILAVEYLAVFAYMFARY